MSGGLERFDAVIVGSGPAGSVAALRLAPTHRVLVLERRTTDAARIGESLPPACRPLLRDLGLLEMVDQHRPYLGNRSLWGARAPATHDFVADPNGAGWHLDRAAFDGTLRRLAVEQGADLRRGITLSDLSRADGRWLLETGDGGRIAADVMIDATGRAASIARRMGARRRLLDRLTGLYAVLRGPDGAASDGFSRIEAGADGWWYTAPVPNGDRVVAYHTDSDRPSLRDLADPAAFLAALGATRMIAGDIPLDGALMIQAPRTVAAGSAACEPAVGDGWLTVGDAALSFDPLSSQGLMNALFTGMAGGDAAAVMLHGDRGAAGDYAARLAAIRHAYEANLANYYAAEAPGQAGEFWRRRTPSMQVA